MNQSTHPAESLSSALTAVILGALTIFGAGLRLHALGLHSLWIDEAASFCFATMPWKHFLHTLWSYQGNMTLYYFLLRAWIHLGDSEFMVRSLGVLFSVLTIPAMYWLGKRLFDQATGLTAAALLSVHSFHILWSQQARAYSLLLLLLVLTAYFLVRAMESNDRLANWLAVAIFAALSVYAHIFAVLVLAAFVLSILFPKPYRVSTRNLFISAVVFEHLIAPMTLFVLLHHSNQINWIPRPSFDEFSGFLQLLTSQGGKILVVAYLGLCGVAFWSTTRAKRSDKENWGLRLLAFWLVLPPLLTLGVTPIKPLFDPGFMVMCVPALVMLAARGLIRSSAIPAIKYWAAAAFVLVISLSLLSIGRPPKYRLALNADWRSAVGYILANERPDDGVIFCIPNDYPYLYYSERALHKHRGAAAPDVLYPRDPWEPLSRQEVEKVTSGRLRVWLVLHNESFDASEETTIESTLNEKYKLAGERVFSGESVPITVELYSATGH
jgi:mannosyltransferase